MIPVDTPQDDSPTALIVSQKKSHHDHHQHRQLPDLQL